MNAHLNYILAQQASPTSNARPNMHDWQQTQVPGGDTRAIHTR